MDGECIMLFEIKWKDDTDWTDTEELNFNSYKSLKEYIEKEIADDAVKLQVVSVREIVCEFKDIDWKSI
jgi:hypothetical protein